MSAIKAHKTEVDTKSSWDGPQAVVDAPAEATVLRYMHAWVDPKGDESKKSSYKFPHHESGTDTAAVIAGVNNALTRLAQAKIPEGDVAGVEAHLRAHRQDAGLEESMSEAEIAEAVKYVKDVDDLKAVESQALLEAVKLQEQQEAVMGNAGRSYRELENLLSAAVRGLWAEQDVFIRDFGPDWVVADSYKLGKSYQYPYSIDEQSRVTLGPPKLVWSKTIYEPVAEGAVWTLKALLADKALPKELHTGIESLMAALQKTRTELAAGQEAAQVELGGDFIPLIEKAVRQDGVVPIKIIKPGWGSSGYYPAEVLKRDGPKIFTKGTKMYWNHQTPQEESARPEGDLNNLAAVLTGDARWLDQGLKGPGLYTDAKVFENYQKPMDDLAPHIGVSIRAYGKASQGTMEGKTGPIISELTARKSVDFVTEPGAGGEIITMFEAARTVRADSQPPTQRGVEFHEEVKMTEEDLKKLQEANATLLKENGEIKAENARLQEALLLREAKDMVGTVLTKSSLPEVTKARLAESLAKAAPVKEGKLDKEAFAKQVAEAVKAEVKYLTEAAGLGNIKGLGESAGEGDEEGQGDKLQESLEESFKAIGLSETAAKTAAKGRSK